MILPGIEQAVAKPQAVAQGNAERIVAGRFVHETMGDDAHRAGFGDGIEGGIGMADGFHRQECSGATLEKLGRRKDRGGANRRLVMSRFQGPDESSKPREQRKIFGNSAKKRLTEVHMNLDQARHDQPAPGINDLIGLFFEG